MQQGELAERLCISRSHLSEIESGRKAASVELLHKFAEVFDVPPSTFLSFAEAIEGSSERRQKNAKRLMKVLEWTLDTQHDASTEKRKSL